MDINPSTKALVHLGDLSKPAVVLIEKISAGFGCVYNPFRIRLEAKANADAARIEAESKIEVRDIEQRAELRLRTEQAVQQFNIERVTEIAVQNVKDDAKPENIDDDWLTSFFQKCRHTSDVEMQNLWASILAGEANKPGGFSKRTLAIVENLDQKDAEMFSKYCRTTMLFAEHHKFPVNPTQEMLKLAGIRPIDVANLESIGLVNFNPMNMISLTINNDAINAKYHNETVRIDMTAHQVREGYYQVGTGMSCFTRCGEELFSVCEPDPIPGLVDLYMNWLKDQGYNVELIEDE